MMTRSYVLLGVRLSVSTLLVLWVADALLDLTILHRIILYGWVVSRPMDYVGLLIADAQVALLIAFIGWLLGPVMALITRSRNPEREALVLSSVGLASLVALAEMVFSWHVPVSNVPLLATVILAIVAALFAVLRLLTGRRARDEWRLGDVVQFAFFPAMIVGYVSQTLAFTTQGHSKEAVIAGVAALFLLTAAVAQGKMRRRFRRSAVRWMPVALAVLLVAYAPVSFSSYGKSHERTRTGPQKSRPNIVLIVLDTVRADHLKSFGYARNTMPALERWARNALVVKRAVSAAGWTPPSHASMFSGLPVSIHGIHGRDDTPNWSYTEPVEGIAWLPEQLAEYGYYCLAVSANHHAIPAGIAGFDRVLIPKRDVWHTSTIGSVADYFSPLFDRLSEHIQWRMPYVDAKQVVDIAQRAAPEGGGPVFLFVNFLDAHAPYNPPKYALDRFDTTSKHLFGQYRSDHAVTELWGSLPKSKFQYLNDLYDGELFAMDHELDRLLHWLDAQYGRDTVIIITSDHGEELGEEGVIGHTLGLSQILLHVPLYVRSPHVPPGEIDDIVTTRNIYDFILFSAAGRETGVETLTRTDEYGIVAARYRMEYDARTYGKRWARNWVALFKGSDKAIGPSQDGFELFDISSNGFDVETPVSVSPAREPLRTRIDAYWEAHRDLREEETDIKPLSDEEQRRLRALGYIK